MSIFNNVLTELKENKQVRLAGGYNCLPWTNLPNLSSIVPGIMKRRYIICTANSKVGKTQLADFLFVYEPYNFIRSNKTNLSLKIFYFTLEMSKEEKIKQAITHHIFRDKKIRLNPEKLDSVFKDYILDDKTEKLIESYSDFFTEFEKTVEYVDSIKNPFGIYKYVRDYAESNGYYEDRNGIKMTLEDARNDPFRVFRYVPNNPNEYVIVLTDHVSLLTPEKDAPTLHAAMSKYSSDYCLKMRDKFGYTIVNVQQQAADQEKQQFTTTGNSIIDKIRPSQDGLGDNRLTGRDCDLMLGLFAPVRYKIGQYPLTNGYNIQRLKDHHRELSIILNRRGSGFINLHLFFDGATNHFEELPPPNNIKYEDFV